MAKRKTPEGSSYLPSDRPGTKARTEGASSGDSKTNHSQPPGYAHQMQVQEQLREKFSQDKLRHFKSCLVLLYNQIKELNLNAKFVANIHDEWQIEVIEDQAEIVGKLGVEAIKNTQNVLNLNCPLDGEYKIGDNWSETH